MPRHLVSRRALMAITASVTLGMASVAANADDPVSFADETVNIVLFAGPGAPPDIWYRTLAPYLQRHLPGNPDINFINKPGAGSMISANYTAQALDPDGLSVGTMNAVAMDRAARGDTSARFDLRDMRIIGANQLTRVMPVNLDGIETIDDLINSENEVIIGMESDATPYFEAFFGLTGINARIISSYQRFPQTLQAFRTGEVDAMPMSNIEWQTFGPSLAEEGAAAIWQMGYLNADGEVVGVEIPPIPTGHDVVRQVNPDAVGGEAWNVMTIAAAGQSISNEVWAPPGTPDAYVEAWRDAFVAATSDPEFIATHLESYGIEPSWTDGAQAREVVDQILALYGR